MWQEYTLQKRTITEPRLGIINKIIPSPVRSYTPASAGINAILLLLCGGGKKVTVRSVLKKLL